MDFTITGLSPEPFKSLVALSEQDLAARNILRRTVDQKPGYPCRISLQDAEPGETVFLLNHESHGGPTPYASRYAIYVREIADQPGHYDNELAPVMHNRPVSLRLFDKTGLLVGADMGMNEDLAAKIRTHFDDPDIAYIHAHNAMHGCFIAAISRKPVE